MLYDSDILIVKDPSSVTTSELDKLKTLGFCYIPLPESILYCLQNVKQMARHFFEQPEKIKRQHVFTDQHREGYLDQRDKNYNIQRYTQSV